MTPKEKALELFEKFKIESYSIDDKDWYVDIDKTKKYINNVINEILLTNPTLQGTSEDLITMIVQTKEYWYRVLEALNNV